MANRRTLIVCLVVSLAACQRSRRSALSEPTSTLREHVRDAQSVEYNESYSKGEAAFIELLGHPGGLNELVDAWAYDDVPEQNWISWSYDYQTRFSDEPAGFRIQGFREAIVEKFKRDPAFAAAVRKRLKSDPVVGGAATYLGSLQSTDPGVRKVAAFWLSQLYPAAPKFDPTAADTVRATQEEELRKYLRTPGALRE
ncbi:MAG: hypothetical protein ACR2OZ_05235 [Verrucomicrobiales bacterium]